jgi:DNA replication initiation complex subunit (GINS family)
MANKIEYTYENIRQLQLKESKSSSLTRIEPDFYEEFLKHLNKLESDYGKLSAKNASKTEAVLLSEEIRKLKGLLSAMYERRERKLIFLAQVEARGGQPNTKNLTLLERDLYEQLVNLLKRTRLRLEPDSSDVEIEHEVSETVQSQNLAAPASGETKKVKAQNVTVQTEPVQAVPKKENGLLLVQILEDIKPFQDESKYEYRLKKEDVLSLPAQYAKVLVKRGAARIIEQNI